MATPLARAPLPRALLPHPAPAVRMASRGRLRATAASGEGAAGPVLRTCKNCKQQYDPSVNHPSACRYHTAHFGGETKRKFESVYAGGTMDTPNSGKVFQYWHCCGSEDPFDPFYLFWQLMNSPYRWNCTNGGFTWATLSVWLSVMLAAPIWIMVLLDIHLADLPGVQEPLQHIAARLKKRA